jgi:amino acid adenylation domain-containing protein/FkbM family methyltransferase
MQKEIVEGCQLSSQQKHIWRLQQEDSSLAYRTQCAILLEGSQNLTALESALGKIIERHEILRTTFDYLPGMTVPIQVFNDVEPPEIALHDLSHLPEPEQRKSIALLSQEAARLPFDFEHGPLLYVSLMTLSPGQSLLLLTLSALCADTATLKTLMLELSRSYEACLTNEESLDEPMQYADFSDWQNELLQADEIKIGRDYWTRQDLSASSTLKLPFDHQPARQSTFDTDSFSVRLDAHGHTELAASLQDRRISSFVLLLTCWQVLLWRLTGQPEIVVGAGYDGRKYQELAETLGTFALYLPVRCHLWEGLSFNDVLQQVDAATSEAYKWQESFSWDYFSDANDNQKSENFCPFSMDFEDETPTYTAAGLTFSIYEQNCYVDRFKVKLSCVQQRDALLTTFHYDCSLFSLADIRRLAERFHTLLADVLVNPDTRIEQLEIVGLDERQQILVEFNDTGAESKTDKCFHQLFDEQAARIPHAVAVAFENQRLSYAELNARSNQLAAYLRRLGVGPEQPVAICVGRSLEMVVGIMGILKAGGAYVPLDPSYPRERLAFMLEDIKASVLLTQNGLREILPEHEARIICLDTDWEIISQESADNSSASAAPEHLAYIIYTSGSTGQPKGVQITHRNLVHSTAARLSYYRQPVTGFLLLSSFSFDSSVAGIFWTLAQGGALILPREELLLDMVPLADLIARHGVSHLLSLPSLYALLLEQAPPENLGSLQTIIVAGEACPKDLLERHAQLLPQAALFNEYGPTEGTVWSSVYDCRLPTLKTLVPIGSPINNTQVYLLDSGLKLVPVGTPGELYIGGLGLARGYLNRPHLTAEKFIPHPFSTEPGARLYKTGDLARFQAEGTIEFLGRTDHQVKIRGYRVELEEIEAVLAQHSGLRDCVVVAREEAPGEQKLVAYLVPHEQRALTVRRLLQLEAEGALDETQRYELPNSMTIRHHNKNEADYSYREIFEEQTYLRHGITLKDGDCIFDVGANIGMFTLFAGRAVKDAVIYAFEPVPPLLEALRVNTRLYGLNVRLFACGLAREEESATFTYYPHLSLMSGRFPDVADDREIVKSFEVSRQQAKECRAEVLSEELIDEMLAERLTNEQFTCRLRTLSNVIGENGVERIDLLKIDVEKSELDVLLGIKDEDWSKIRQIVIEVQDVDGRLDSIKSLLETEGYAVSVQQESMLERTNLYNVYAIRNASDDKPASTHEYSFTPPQHGWESASFLLDDVQGFLRERLPEYMIPGSYVMLLELPVGPNGKIDRRALPEPARQRTRLKENYAPPRTQPEKLLAEIWEEILGIERVGIHDNFFALGGHSIRATQLIARLRRTFQIMLPVRSVFEAPTIAALAAVVLQAQEEQKDMAFPTIKRAGTENSAELLARLDQLSPEEMDALLSGMSMGDGQES